MYMYTDTVCTIPSTNVDINPIVINATIPFACSNTVSVDSSLPEHLPRPVNVIDSLSSHHFCRSVDYFFIHLKREYDMIWSFPQHEQFYQSIMLSLLMLNVLFTKHVHVTNI